MTYPEDCIQSFAKNWWEKDEDKQLSRGALIYAHIQFFSQIPLKLIAKREDPRNHDKVNIIAVPAFSSNSQQESPLPTAAFPRLDGADCYIVNRAKKRPCVVVGKIERLLIPKELTRNMSNHQTAPFVAIAPFFGVEQKERSGYNPEFVERIRHAKYPQFMWDILPHTGKESILRFDQIQPLGIHHDSHEHTGYKLSDEALMLFDEYLYWLLNGKIGEELSAIRELFD